MKIKNLVINKDKARELCENGLLIGMFSLYAVGIAQMIYITVKSLIK